MSKPTLMLLLSTLVALVGCSEKPQVAEPKRVGCNFPFSEQPAPQWICDQSSDQLAIAAVGSAEHNAAGYSYMLDIAMADARGKIAEQMQVEVQKMIKNYFGSTGIEQQQTVDRVAESVLKTISNQRLRGSRTIDSVTDNQQRLYVLVGLDEQAFQQSAQNAVSTSINNEQALWQQFKAKQGFDELATEIAKQPR